MTPQEQLHADIVELINSTDFKASTTGQLATAIIDLIRSRLEVVTPEMLAEAKGL